MSDLHDRVAQLREQAGKVPNGPTRVALLEEAVQLADAAQDVDLAYDARQDLIQSSAFAGRSDVMLVAFAWCLAQYDRNPTGRQSPLWQYKWVLSNAFEYYEISRARLEGLFTDFERRCLEAGSTMYAARQLRRELFWHYDERKNGQAAHAAFRKCRRDFLSDCAACVAYKNLQHYVWQRQWSRAMQAAQPVLSNRLSCMEQPHRMLSGILLPLVRLGRMDEAKTYQRQGYRRVSGEKHFVGAHAQQLQFLAISGESAQAKQVLERHLPGALEYREPRERFEFFLAAKLWIDLQLSRNTRRMKIRLPKELPPPDSDGTSDLPTLSVWFTTEAREIARRFDARNGTAGFQQQLDELPELHKLAVKTP